MKFSRSIDGSDPLLPYRNKNILFIQSPFFLKKTSSIRYFCRGQRVQGECVPLLLLLLIAVVLHTYREIKNKRSLVCPLCWWIREICSLADDLMDKETIYLHEVLSSFNSLKELLPFVFSYLDDHRDLYRASLVNKNWNAESKKHWRSLILRHYEISHVSWFHRIPCSSTANSISWSRVYHMDRISISDRYLMIHLVITVTITYGYWKLVISSCERLLNYLSRLFI